MAKRAKHSTTLAAPNATRTPPAIRTGRPPGAGRRTLQPFSRYGTRPATVAGAAQKKTNEPISAPTLVRTPAPRHRATSWWQAPAPRALGPRPGERSPEAPAQRVARADGPFRQ